MTVDASPDDSEIVLTRNLDAKNGLFSRSNLWPRGDEELNFQKWLKNFEAGIDKEIAASIADQIIFYNQDLTFRLVLSAFSQISKFVSPQNLSADARIKKWVQFLSTDAIITYPTTREREVTGSGTVIATKLRDSFQLSEDAFFSPIDALRKIFRTPNESRKKSLIFVDDFTGTGQQLLDTWSRDYSINQHVRSSLGQEESSIESIFVVTAFSTTYSLKRISEKIPRAITLAANTIDERYSLNNSNNPVVQAYGVDRVREFLLKYHGRTQPEEIGPFGFGNLGLCLGINGRFPDNTIPIIRSKSNESWNSLTGQ